MKTNYVPAIVMLCAGFIDCLFAIYNHLELGRFIKELLIVLIIFLIIGYTIKFVMDKFFHDKTDEDKDETQDVQEAEQKAASGEDDTEAEKVQQEEKE